MTDDPLALLLVRLNRGDATAARQVVETYEPYLRLVVRRSLSRQLRAKFDSVDVVQSVWLHVLHGLQKAEWKFADKGQLVAFLVTVTRRRLASRARRHRFAVEHEQRGGSLEDLPGRREAHPSEAAQADELWEKMLALAAPEHHEILRLRRQGLLLAEIGVRTGMHEGSVRRILRRLSRALALEAAASLCSR
jgi:RNA polymerase sigma-70 factor (ECF subfamily)